MAIRVARIVRYVLIVGLPIVAVLVLLRLGRNLSAPTAPRGRLPANRGGLIESESSLIAPFGTLLMEVAVILVVARALSTIFRKLSQPPVIGEMIAGILLGPSLLGWVAPDLFAALFPVENYSLLGVMSELGLVLFLFLIGLEHDPVLMRGRAETAVLTSHVSIAFPFCLGVLLALFLYPRLGDGRVPFTHFALFMGSGMSITAFPVLARILADRALLHTPVGLLALICASVDDVTGWLILAGVLLLIGASPTSLPLWASILGTGVYALVMLRAGRRLFAHIGVRFRAHGLTMNLLAIMLLIALVSAWITEQLGIHPLFGAFLAGIAMPRDRALAEAVWTRLHDVTILLFVPLFFALTGLKTSIVLLGGLEMWAYFALILTVAVAGKLGGAAFAARIAGVPWREAISLGVLVNTRGLVELVVLNIGLEVGVISPRLFAMMVLMAITTTLMATPLLDLIYPPRLRGPAASRVATPGDG